MDLKVARRNLLDIKKALDKSKLRYWLAMGTFLGAYRDGAIIPYDEDTDLMMLAEDLSYLLTAQGIMHFVGFEVRVYPCWIAFYRDGEHTDIYLFRPIGNKRDWLGIKYDADAFETYNEVKFLNRKWRILNEPERWLKYTYGEDWRTPIEGKGICGPAYGAEFEE